MRSFAIGANQYLGTEIDYMGQAATKRWVYIGKEVPTDWLDPVFAPRELLFKLHMVESSKLLQHRTIIARIVASNMAQLRNIVRLDEEQ